MSTEKNAVATIGTMQLPDYLRDAQKTTKIGNIDKSDLIIPRVKLLQAISPELQENNAARAGEFWHNLAGISFGSSVQVVPILLRKSYVLWSPRNDDRGILARARDAMKWDQEAGMEFTVKPKNSPKPVTYKLGATVHERIDGQPALSEFGSSIPEDPNSPPAAALTYELLFISPQHMELGPFIVINTRSSVRPAKDLINKTEISPVDHYYGVYTMSKTDEKGDEGPYFNYKYTANGFAPQEIGELAKSLYEQYKDVDYRADDEDAGEEASRSGGSAPKQQGNVSNKF